MPTRIWPPLAALNPVYIHLLVIGWLTQLIYGVICWMVQLAMGVAYWIFPRILLTDRGRSHIAWAAFVVLQVGLALTIASLLQVW